MLCSFVIKSLDNAHSVAFSQRSSNPRLIEDETFNDSDIINNLINYKDGQEARSFESAVDTRRYPRVENRVWSDQEDHEERGSNDHAENTCGPHSDSLNDMSRRRRSNCSPNNFQTPCRSRS
ncbi:hypothetical protein TNCV_1771381 [Trichonephila clavipes]|nr:hypothetical protein TNCV_1771381 [Trichonephila clavipes]